MLSRKANAKRNVVDKYKNFAESHKTSRLKCCDQQAGIKKSIKTTYKQYLHMHSFKYEVNIT